MIFSLSKFNLSISSLSQEIVYSLLHKADPLFYPPLSENVDLSEYSNKLSDRGKFITAMEGDKTVAFLAFYENHEKAQLYVPLVCVTAALQHTGIGTRLFYELELYAGSRYKSVGLEVVKANTKAYKFYIKQGFKIEEDRGEKYLMKKML